MLYWTYVDEPWGMVSWVWLVVKCVRWVWLVVKGVVSIKWVWPVVKGVVSPSIAYWWSSGYGSPHN